jgi:hypothetical protein
MPLTTIEEGAIRWTSHLAFLTLAALVCAAPSRASATRHATHAPAASMPRPGNVYLITGEPCADTLGVPWRAVFRAAQRVFVQDQWRIERADSSAREIETEWKPLDKAIARMIVGDVDGKCVVEITPLGPRSTLVVFHGYMASPKSLEENPRLKVGQHAYRLAALDWHAKVRGMLGVRDP